MGVRNPRRSSMACAPFSSPFCCMTVMVSANLTHSYSIDRPPSAIAFCVSSIVRTDGCQMIGSATWSGSLVPLSARIDRRSLVYHREFWKANSAAATPCTAVPRRDVLMKVNMWLSPRFSVPMSQPCASSNSIWHVGEPWHPILSSMRETPTPFSSPLTPSSPTLRLGTRNNEMPFVPAGAPGRRARTQWITFSVKSWSPHEMKILVPEMR
mmetsp:Transcript_41528/g.103228  ORF Transcript_41528/g.103228 Transcript_41528/m.103228 type:complete len:211 (-) Transcript_41528:652-1284(-)